MADTDYRAIARSLAAKYGVDPDIFERQIQQESGFSVTAKSPAGATGIAQIMSQYHPGVDPNDPVASLDYAARLMAGYLKQYNGDYAKALAAYNSGAGNVEKYGGVPPFEETQRYVKNILGQPAQGKAPKAPGLASPMFADPIPSVKKPIDWKSGAATIPDNMKPPESNQLQPFYTTSAPASKEKPISVDEVWSIDGKTSVAPNTPGAIRSKIYRYASGLVEKSDWVPDAATGGFLGFGTTPATTGKWTEPYWFNRNDAQDAKNPYLTEDPATGRKMMPDGKGGFIPAPGLGAPTPKTSEPKPWQNPTDGSVIDLATGDMLSPAVPGWTPGLGVRWEPQGSPSEWARVAQDSKEFDWRKGTEFPWTQETWNKTYGQNQQKIDMDAVQNEALRKQWLAQNEQSKNELASSMADWMTKSRLDASKWAMLPGQEYFLGFEPGGPWADVAKRSGFDYDPNKFRPQSVDINPEDSLNGAAAWLNTQAAARRGK